MKAKRANRGTGSGRGDYRYLTQPRGDGTTWYAIVDVPRPLRGVLGKKRMRSLETTSTEVARAARWKVVADLKAQIEAARRPGDATKDDPISQEALALREQFTRASARERDDLMYEIIDRAHEIDTQERGPLEEPRSSEDMDEDVPSQKATDYVKLATGKATPLRTYEDRWLASTDYTERTKSDARVALKMFEQWAARTQRRAFIEAVDDRMAADFRDEALIKAGVHPKTANKKLSALRQYWAWLDKSFGIRPNPWAGKSLAKPKPHRIAPDGPDGPEKDFTNDAMIKLLSGDADADLADFIRIAALSGMRIEEIGQLRVKDCQEDCFAITRGKTAASIRKVPIHSALKELVAYRVKNKPGDAYLFPDLPSTGWDGDRTMAISKRFRPSPNAWQAPW